MDELLDPGSCINWSSYSYSAIWAMLESENEWVNSIQASAWNRTYELLDSHLVVLKLLRDEAVEKWPAQASTAAAALVVQLDRLIDSMTAVSHAAARNGLAIWAISEALIEAKNAVQSLSPIWARGGADRATAEIQARKTIAAADQAVYGYAQQLSLPPGYTWPGRADEDTEILEPLVAKLNVTQSSPLISYGMTYMQDHPTEIALVQSHFESLTQDGRIESNYTALTTYSNTTSDPYAADNASNVFFYMPLDTIAPRINSGARDSSPVSRITKRQLTFSEGFDQIPVATTRSGDTAMIAGTLPEGSQTPEYDRIVNTPGPPVRARSRQQRRLLDARYKWQSPTGSPPVIGPSPIPQRDDFGCLGLTIGPKT